MIPRYKGAAELEERTGKNAEDFLDYDWRDTEDEEDQEEEE
jgi:hypothetical protein